MIQSTPLVADSSISSLADVLKLAEGDMQAVNETIRHSLDSPVVLIRQIAEYIIGSGGKRLRPLLVVLAARAAGYQGDRHTSLAAIIEFIHTATLLHDDVVDESEMRRGNQTANTVWGNSASVLVGDFLYSRAFQMMVGLDSMEIMRVLADATNTISEGEVQQLLNIGNLEITEAEYDQTIGNKTAKLFEAGCQLAAEIAGTPALAENLASYGRHLGMAFQIADDVLDYACDNPDLDKNLGDDLAEGKLTLPLIYLLENGSESDRAAVEKAIRHPDSGDFERIQQRLENTHALAYSQQRAAEFARLAQAQLHALPKSPFRDALAFLTQFAWNRTK